MIISRSISGSSLLGLFQFFDRSKSERPRVWLVDDLEVNRKDFQRDHESDFEITVFERPSAVLQAFRTSEPPDVLVQPEMERGRSPLVSNSTLRAGIFKASIRPAGYSSAWLRPSRGRCRSARQDHCSSTCVGSA